MNEVVLAPSKANMKSSRPRLGFLGVGWIGRNRLQAIAETGLADIAAISDTHPEMLQQAQSIAETASVARSLEEMLTMDLDAVVIATPNVLHAPQAVSALEQGLAVFCQKPLARNAHEAKTVVDAARRSDRLLSVDLSYRCIPAMVRIRNLIRQGDLGEIYAVNLVFHNAYGPVKPWFYDRSLSGGGCLLDLGVHLVDLAMWTLGWPHCSAARGQLYTAGSRMEPRGQQVEDFAAATIEFATGTSTQLACSWKLSAGCDAVIEASFFGTRGGASLRNINGSFMDFEGFRFHGTRRELLSTQDDRWFGQSAVEWTQRLVAGERFDPETEHLVTVSKVLDAIYGQGDIA